MNLIKENVYNNFFTISFFSVSAEFFIGSALLQLSIYSIVIINLKKENHYLPNYFFLSFLVFFLSSFLIYNETFVAFNTNFDSTTFFFKSDYLAFVSKITLCFFISLFLISCQFYKSKISLQNSFEYSAFIISSGLGSIILCSSNDFMTSYLALELQSISFYLMSCSKKNSSYSIEGGLKYFVVGSLSSAIYLFGVSLIYGFSGTLNFNELQLIASFIPDIEVLTHKTKYNYSFGFCVLELGFLLVFLSLLIKLAIAPFHYWSLDVYESSSNSTTFYFALVPKLGLFILLVRIFYLSSFNIFVKNLIELCLLFAFSSILVGALGGIEQRKLKTLLAYSSISHTGYILLAFGSGTEESLVFMLYYIFVYMLSTSCFWFVLMFLKQRRIGYEKKNNKELGDLVLLKKTNPLLALVFLTTVFSMAGIPPLIGFLIKFNLFFSVLQSSAYVVAVFAVLLSVISTFYYLRLIKIVYFENRIVGKLYYPVSSKKSILVSFCFFALILLFLKPNLLYLIFYKTVLLVS